MANRIVVTGVTSFIGIAIVKYLKKDISSGIVAIARQNSSRIQLLKHHNIEFLECNLAELLSIYDNKQITSSDIFFHVAWSSDFENPRYNREGQLKNVDYLLDAITLAHKLGCHTFVGIGSQAECGVVNSPIDENTMDNPLTAYAEAKCIAYEKGKALAESYGMKFCWPRLLSAYGPYDRPHTLISSCICAGIEKKRIDFSGCEQIWDYIHVDDVARALMDIALKGEHGTKYPIASGQGRKLREYIEIIANETKFPQLLDGIGNSPYIDGQPMYLVGNLKKLTEDTGFAPCIDFKKGIHEMIRV